MLDKKFCRGGRRLFYTAYGTPVCDCPVGQYPFPKEGDDCVPLFTQGDDQVFKSSLQLLITQYFTQGPCPDYEVVTPSASGGLKCKPNVCKATFETIEDFILQLFPFPDDQNYYGQTCFAMGTIGPCYTPDKVLGYNIFDRRGECVDLLDPTTPYFLSPELNAKLDEAFNEDGKEDFKFENWMTMSPKIHPRAPRKGRQANTRGVMQVNNNYGSSTMNSCQPGGKSGNNVKCSNPLV